MFDFAVLLRKSESLEEVPWRLRLVLEERECRLRGGGGKVGMMGSVEARFGPAGLAQERWR